MEVAGDPGALGPREDGAVPACWVKNQHKRSIVMLSEPDHFSMD